MSVCALICRTCGGVYDLSAGENHKPCPACGTENCRPQAEADVGDILRRATGQRLRCDFKHAEASYQFVLNTSPDEHEALWGLVQCRYAVEYVKDPRTGKPQPIVHAVRTRPMLTDPDFREACSLAPEAVRAQYRQEAEYIDNAMARIRELGATGDAYDIFLCHKTSRTDGEEGYTEDYNRAVQLYIMLREMGYRVFFAPFARLTPGNNYEAGIYHAISAAKVMLVICSNQDYINSPWVRTEWQRFLEMSYEPGADKHLIPLLYDSFPPRLLPDDFRQLQAIAMGELNAKDSLMAALEKHVGRSAPASVPVGEGLVPSRPAPQPVRPVPAPTPVGEGLAPSRPASQPMRPVPAPTPVGEGLVPSRPAHHPTPAYAPESHFKTEAVDGGVAITGYTGPGGEVLIPPTIGGEQVVEIGGSAFFYQKALTKVVIPDSVTSIRNLAFRSCSRLKTISVAAENKMYYVHGNVLFSRQFELVCYPAGLTASSYVIPDGVTRIENHAFESCSSLISVTIPDSMTSIGELAFSCCSRLTSVNIPDSVSSIGELAFFGCSRLTSLSIPEGVTSIGLAAFNGCPILTLRVHPNTPAHAYAHNKNLRFELVSRAPVVAPTRPAAPAQPKPAPQPTPAYAPESDFETEAVVGGLAITKYTGPGGEVLIPPMIGGKRVTIIGGWAFDGCSSLTSISIPEGVRSIGGLAFKGCSSLTSVSIPEGVESIGSLAFNGCSSLTSVNIPESVTSIGEWAFSGCSSLTSVSIPEGVKRIWNGTFSDCPYLTLLVHPSTPAHTYAQQNNIRFELIVPTPVGEGLVPSRPAPQPAPQPAPKKAFLSRLFSKS